MQISHLKHGHRRAVLSIAILGALAGCGGGSNYASPVSSTSQNSAASPAPGTPATQAATLQWWPTPAQPQPVQGVLSGVPLRQYIQASERYMLANPQLLDQTATLAGVTNAHGIRVDIYNWIQTLPITPAQMAAMVQDAHALQDAILVDTTNAQAVANVDKEGMAAAHCDSYSFPIAFNGSGWSTGLELMTANTPARQAAYIAFNKAPHGPTDVPPWNTNTCVTY